MAILKKAPGKDFVVLNLTDPQISTEDLESKNNAYSVMCGTVRELVEQVKPDLITITGDLTYGGSISVYEFYADFMDSIGINWAFVWGNHDNQAGIEATHAANAVFAAHPLCLFEAGDEKLGNGNYIIEIHENDKPVEALFMMDSHDRIPYGEGTAWAKLIPEQIEWYRERVAELSSRGCHDSTIFTHIPIYAYRDAYKAAVRDISQKHTVWESYGKSVWNDEYRDSFGINWEGICSFEEDEGMMDAMTELYHTKNFIVGHDHINNSSINYRGIRLTYSLKTGPGCYWDRRMNGGTVIRISENGVSDLYHVYIDPHTYEKE